MFIMAAEMNHSLPISNGFPNAEPLFLSEGEEKDSMTQENFHDKQGLEPGGSPQALIAQHPLGIKPMGNHFVTGNNIKGAAGVFSCLPDELLIQILEILEPLPLIQLGATCKALYGFSRFEDLWRSQFLKYAFLF